MYKQEPKHLVIAKVIILRVGMMAGRDTCENLSRDQQNIMSDLLEGGTGKGVNNNYPFPSPNSLGVSGFNRKGNSGKKQS